jgi:hypothetical protein
MWMNDPMSSIDAENIEKNVSDAYKSMHKAIKQFADFESNLSFFYNSKIIYFGKIFGQRKIKNIWG